MSDLPKRLRIKASMIALGERIPWGSDTALMEEAADVIEALIARVENHQLHMLGMARDRDQLRAMLSEQQQASRCSDCGYLTSQREHLGCLRKAVAELDAATGGQPQASSAQSAPAGVVPRKVINSALVGPALAYCQGWNSALDEVAMLSAAQAHPSARQDQGEVQRLRDALEQLANGSHLDAAQNHDDDSLREIARSCTCGERNRLLKHASPDVEWLVKALTNLLSYAERQICTHEETHRGGAIWEICDMCGAKWADDEGGKPDFEWPAEIEAARGLLAASTGQEVKP